MSTKMKTVAEVHGTVGKPVAAKAALTPELFEDLTAALAVADELASAVIRSESQGQMQRALSFVRAMSEISRVHRVKVGR